MASEKDFSAEKLDRIRSGTSFEYNTLWSTRSFWRKYVIDRTPPPTASELLDNEIHPLFQWSNWISTLPMHEVKMQLDTALQLATKFITDDHALAWFVRVRFTDRAEFNPSGINRLMCEKGIQSITREMLDIVKSELQSLAGIVKFAWIAEHERGSEELAPGGVTCASARSVIHNLQGDLLSALGTQLTEECLVPWMLTIFINISYFYMALRHRHHGTTPAAQRAFQLTFATLLLHEFAHVWLSLCHPWVL